MGQLIGDARERATQQEQRLFGGPERPSFCLTGEPDAAIPPPEFGYFYLAQSQSWRTIAPVTLFFLSVGDAALNDPDHEVRVDVCVQEPTKTEMETGPDYVVATIDQDFPAAHDPLGRFPYYRETAINPAIVIPPRSNIGFRVRQSEPARFYIQAWFWGYGGGSLLMPFSDPDPL